jgi:hypothetical protein
LNCEKITRKQGQVAHCAHGCHGLANAVNWPATQTRQDCPDDGEQEIAIRIANSDELREKAARRYGPNIDDSKLQLSAASIT